MSRLELYASPEFAEGELAALSHYGAVEIGERSERPFAGNPYPRPESANERQTPWHRWNAGWNRGVPELERAGSGS